MISIAIAIVLPRAAVHVLLRAIRVSIVGRRAPLKSSHGRGGRRKKNARACI